MQQNQPSKKSKEDLMASLSANLPAETKMTESVHVVKSGPTNMEIIADGEEDYTYARDRIKKLLDTSDEAIASMLNLAVDSEAPRAFEVLSTMIKNSADINQQLLTLLKQRKNIAIEPSIKGAKANETSNSSNITTNNSIFVGTTTELQKFLHQQHQSNPKVLDV